MTNIYSNNSESFETFSPKQIQDITDSISSAVEKALKEQLKTLSKSSVKESNRNL